MVIYQRRLPQFTYLAPGTLTEALEMRALQRGACMVMAGGTDLVPKLKSRKITAPQLIIDLKHIPDLDYIRYDEKNGLSIGALATLRAIEKSSLICAKYPILSEAAASMASIQVRNRGTAAGNICNAVPSADLAPALLVLEAGLILASKQGVRRVDIRDFFTGPNQTVVREDEILTEISVPVLPPGSRGCYLKLSPRRAMDLAVTGVAVLGTCDNGVFKKVRIGLGAVAPTPIRAKKAEEILRGQEITADNIEKAAEAAAQEARPIDDHRASADYRREMVKVLTRRALEQISASRLA
jgi:CO/xanthine dehydrogenase FAD-binding subunit